MKIKANKNNIKKYAKELLGVEYTPETEKKLLEICLKKSPRDFHDGTSHFSFAVRDYLEQINKILGTHGVESLYHAFGCNDGIDLEYCNAGDTYAITIYWYRGCLNIGDWGSVLENHPRFNNIR